MTKTLFIKDKCFHSYLFFLVITLSLIGCSVDDEINSPLPDSNPNSNNLNTETQSEQNIRIEKVISTSTFTTNLAITTVDNDGDYIGNVNITINGINYETAASGRVLIENISVNEDFLFITGNKTGYEKIMKTVTPSKNGLTIVQLTLRDDVPEQTFSASQGGVVKFDDVTLDFPTDAIIDANGDAYSGAVTINTVYHDPSADNFASTQPGALVGLEENNDLTALVSFGMVTIDLVDASGAPLNIAEGERVSLTMPASADAPNEIPLWNLNETHGLWVEVGIATKNGDIYEFEVAHFSSYNLDVKVDALDKICFVVQDENGSPIANQKVIVRLDGDIITNVVTNTIVEVSTDNEGEFCIVRAPKGEYTLELDFTCESVTAPAQNIELDGTYTFDFNIENIPSVRAVDYSGQVLFCNDELAKNKGFVIEFIDVGVRKYLFGYSDNDGNYNINTVFCDVDPDVYEACVHILDDGVDRINNFDIDLREDSLVFDLTGCDIVVGFNENTIIPIPDDSLRSAILEELGKATNEVITLGEAQSLTELELYFENIKDLTGLEFFTNLTVLNLNFNDIADVSPLSGLTNLTDIQLSENSITDIESISGLINLTNLYLGSNTITEIGSIGDLTNLTSLVLSDNNIEDINPIANLTNLTNLVLFDNAITDINPIITLTNLTNLDLTNNDITNISSISSLVNLNHLRLSGSNDIIDISSIAALTNLIDLELNGNSISDISSLESLTNLTSLSLGYNDITDISPIGGLVNLNYLYIDGNDITDISSIGSLTNLTTLSFNENKIVDISSLESLTNLTSLSLDFNNIIDVKPLQNLTGLEKLRLVWNNISQAQQEELKEALPNTEIGF